MWGVMNLSGILEVVTVNPILVLDLKLVLLGLIRVRVQPHALRASLEPTRQLWGHLRSATVSSVKLEPSLLRKGQLKPTSAKRVALEPIRVVTGPPCAHRVQMDIIPKRVRLRAVLVQGVLSVHRQIRRLCALLVHIREEV